MINELALLEARRDELSKAINGRDHWAAASSVQYEELQNVVRQIEALKVQSADVPKELTEAPPARRSQRATV